MTQQVDEKKLTPKEAFEYLQAVFPWLKRIEKCKTNQSAVVLEGIDLGHLVSNCNICWGDVVSYRPDIWRPATIEDVVRHMNGEKVTARIGERVGRLFGASKTNSVISFGVDFGDDKTWSSSVEVRE